MPASFVGARPSVDAVIPQQEQGGQEQGGDLIILPKPTSECGACSHNREECSWITDAVWASRSLYRLSPGEREKEPSREEYLAGEPQILEVAQVYILKTAKPHPH